MNKWRNTQTFFLTVLITLSVPAIAQIGFENNTQETAMPSGTIIVDPNPNPNVQVRFSRGDAQNLYIGKYGRESTGNNEVGWFNSNGADYAMPPGLNCSGLSPARDDMVPNRLPGGTPGDFNKSPLGCYFLTESNAKAPSAGQLADFSLDITYLNTAVGGASGVLLDVDGGEAWTITAYADPAMNQVLTTKRVCGDGVTTNTSCDYQGTPDAIAASTNAAGDRIDAVIPWSVACPNMRAIRITYSGEPGVQRVGLGFDNFDVDDPLPDDNCDLVNELPPPVAECCCGNDTIRQERSGVRQMWGISANGGFLRRQWNGNQWVSEIIAPVPNNVPLVAKSLHQNIWQWGVVAVDSQGYLHITRNVSGSWESGRPIPQIVKRLGGFDPCSVIVTDKGIWGLSKTGKLVRLYPGGGEWHFELIDTGNSEISPGSLFEGFDGSIGGLLTNGQPWGLWLNEGQWKFDWMGTDLLAPPSNCSATQTGNVLSDSVATH